MAVRLDLEADAPRTNATPLHIERTVMSQIRERNSVVQNSEL
jgi:hypothetical protein